MEQKGIIYGSFTEVGITTKGIDKIESEPIRMPEMLSWVNAEETYPLREVSVVGCVWIAFWRSISFFGTCISFWVNSLKRSNSGLVCGDFRFIMSAL
jgi:hypothetical protein